MSTQSEVMHCYEQITLVTERMLLLTTTGQWAALPLLELQYSETVERLRVIEPLEVLLEDQLKRKFQLLQRITVNHANINAAVLPQLNRLGDMLQSLEQQHELHNAYSQTSDIYL